MRAKQKKIKIWILSSEMEWMSIHENNLDEKLKYSGFFYKDAWDEDDTNKPL